MKQLMHKGGLYTDAGSFPTDYWAAGTNYVQTADIDLLGDSSDIKPIGLNGDVFSGNYDGGEFRISNWSYLDPEFSTANDCEMDVGVFGHADGSVLKNIFLSGVYKLKGFKRAAGFFCGYPFESDLSNIESDFSVGTELSVGKVLTSNFWVGGLVGSLYNGHTTGLTLRGHVDFDLMLDQQTGASAVGGVLGSTGANGSGGANNPVLQQVRNLGTFASGLKGTRVGGISGVCSYLDISFCLNAMRGDIIGVDWTGGLFGQVLQTHSSGGTWGCDHLVNSMVGNITTTGAGPTGGIVGNFRWGAPGSDFYNYMSGDIVSIDATTTGGLIGANVVTTDNPVLTNAFNAMNGTVANAIGGSGSSSAGVQATSITTFGLSFTSNTNGTTPVGGGVLLNSELNLPYFEFTGADSVGNTYTWDFVFANLAGNPSFSQYTHLSLHKGDVYAPFYVDLDLAGSNSVTYLTYTNLDNKTVFTDGSLVVLAAGEKASVYDYTGLVTLFSAPTPLALEPRSINVPVVIEEVPGAIGYNVTYEGPTGGEITAVSGVTTLEHNITGLVLDTQYTIKLYADTGTGYVLTEELTTTTLPNVATNYDITDFQQGGVFNLSSLPEATISIINKVMNDLFSTGDTVSVSVKNFKVNTSFIKLGDILSIGEINGVLLPFEETSGAGQDVSVILSDGTTTVSIGYDDTVDSITVSGVTYFPGESFILDGQKVTVVEY